MSFDLEDHLEEEFEDYNGDPRCEPDEKFLTNCQPEELADHLKEYPGARAVEGGYHSDGLFNPGIFALIVPIDWKYPRKEE